MEAAGCPGLENEGRIGGRIGGGKQESRKNVEYLDITNDAFRACVGATAAAYAMAGLGLNLQFGFTGLLNLGHVGSLMLGAYGTAISVDLGLPLGAGIIIGVLTAVIAGLILGLFTLRLRQDYLAIVTIAFAEILRLVIRSSWADPLTHSVYGIQRFADAFYDINPIPDRHYGFGDFTFTDRTLWLMAAAWPTVLIIGFLIQRMIKSPWGRVIKAVREDEDVARSLGKNVFLYKIQSLCIGGAFGALGGITLAIDQQNVEPNFYIPIITFYIYVIVIMGGTHRVWGPVIGAVAFWFIFEWLTGFARGAIDSGWFGDLLNTSDAGPIRQILVGAGLLLLMVFRPEGIIGKKERQDRQKEQKEQKAQARQKGAPANA